MRRFFILLLIVFSLGACGQKGDLYLEADKAPPKPTITADGQNKTTSAKPEQSDSNSDF